jgi:hypothetical protein
MYLIYCCQIIIAMEQRMFMYNTYFTNNNFTYNGNTYNT